VGLFCLQIDEFVLDTFGKHSLGLKQFCPGYRCTSYAPKECTASTWLRSTLQLCPNRQRMKMHLQCRSKMVKMMSWCETAWIRVRLLGVSSRPKPFALWHYAWWAKGWSNIGYRRVRLSFITSLCLPSTALLLFHRQIAGIRIRRQVTWRLKLLDTQTTFSSTFSDIETLWRLKQTITLAGNNLFGWLRVTYSHCTNFHSRQLYFHHLWCHLGKPGLWRDK